MNCPTCKASELRPVLTKQGVEVDYCDSCAGIWLDKGEIFHFTKRRKELANSLKSGVQQARPTSRQCPKTGEALQELPLFDGTLVIDYCPASGGMWFDKGELKKVLTVDPRKLAIKIEPWTGEDDASTAEPAETDPQILATPPSPLPNLALRATMTVVSLYALLTLVLVLCVEFAKLPPSWALLIGVAIALVQFLLGPWLMDLSLNWFYKMQWVPFHRLPVHLHRFVQQVCKEKLHKR